MDMLERGFDGGLPCHPGRFDHLCLRSTEDSVPEKVSQTLTAFHPTPELARAVWVTGRAQCGDFQGRRRHPPAGHDQGIIPSIPQ